MARFMRVFKGRLAVQYAERGFAGNSTYLQLSKWLALLPKKFNKQQLYSWRLAPSEFGRAAAPQSAAARPRNLRRADVGDPQTDDEA